MPRKALLAFALLALVSVMACNFSIGSSGDIAKANQLVDESNTAQTDGMKLKQEALAKYQDLVNKAKESDDPFSELANLGDQFKKLEPQLEMAQNKLRQAAEKNDEASKLSVPDWFKQYLSTRADWIRKESELSGLAIQIVKITYDPSITTEEDFLAKKGEIDGKMSAIQKEQDELKAKVDKISDEHKDDFKK